MQQQWRLESNRSIAGFCCTAGVLPDVVVPVVARGRVSGVAVVVGGRLVVRSKVNRGTEAKIIIPAARAYAKLRSPRRSAFLRRGA